MTYTPYLDEPPVAYITTGGQTITEPNLEASPAKQRMRIAGSNETFTARHRHQRLFQHVRDKAHSNGENLGWVINPRKRTGFNLLTWLAEPHNRRLELPYGDGLREATITLDLYKTTIEIHISVLGDRPIEDYPIGLADKIRTNPWSLARNWRIDQWIAGHGDDVTEPLRQISGIPMPYRNHDPARRYGLALKHRSGLTEFQTIAQQLASIETINIPFVHKNSQNVYVLPQQFDRRHLNEQLEAQNQNDGALWDDVAERIVALVGASEADSWQAKTLAGKIEALKGTGGPVAILNNDPKHPIVLHIPTLTAHTVCQDNQKDPSDFEFELQKARIQGLEREFLAFIRDGNSQETEVEQIVNEIKRQLEMT